MRILLCSHWFSPSIGGVETISKILAEEFGHAGHTVTVVTSTPGPAMDGAFALLRQPGHSALVAAAQKSDVVFQNMISLRTLVSVILARKPIVVTHQSWMRRTDGSRGIENYLKLVALRACTNVSISKAIAAELPVKSTIIGNPFEASAFAGRRAYPRTRDIVFLGRLVSDKGCDLLLKALGMLKAKRLFPTLTVIGDGPEMAALVGLTTELGLEKQVEFTGSMQEGRGEVVARHRIMAVPSLWAEPFGVVALEGIASGCAIIASAQGGLPDAGGSCGLYFPNGDVPALADAIEKTLTDPALLAKFVDAGPQHLKSFQPAYIAGRYLDVFHRVTGT